MDYEFIYTFDKFINIPFCIVLGISVVYVIYRLYTRLRR